jgi:hypothetical protein
VRCQMSFCVHNGRRNLKQPSTVLGKRMLFTLLLERLDRWLRNTHRTRCDEYLAASKDIAELERRMKECDG